MLIDWFTVGAQALNFAVLVWLLKRFLYQPVLDAIAARETLIAHQLADAAAVKSDAQQQREAFQQKSQLFDAERAGLLDAATREALAERERLMTAARRAADALAAQRQEALRSEAAQWQQALTEGTRREVFEITRRVLADLATADLEERLADVLVRRLDALKPATRDLWSLALGAPGAQAKVRSAFDLPGPARTAIKAAVNACAGTEVPLTFAVDVQLVCGIELVCGGEKLAWSVNQYLNVLERTVADLVTPVSPPTASATAASAPAGKP